jgi:hypothetical protein
MNAAVARANSVRHWSGSSWSVSRSRRCICIWSWSRSYSRSRSCSRSSRIVEALDEAWPRHRLRSEEGTR